MSPTNPSSSLSAFLSAVEGHIRCTLERAPIHREQQRILLSIACEDGWRNAPLRHALVPYYLLVRAHGAAPELAAQRVGAGVLLAQRCMCMIDDVEDDELAGATAQAGSVIAINAGLTLYLLAVEELLAAEPPTTIGLRVWRSFYTHALRLSQAQHRDLSGRWKLRSPAEAVDLATEKSAICSILFESAGICGVGAETLEPYRAAADALACMQQTVDDISDLFAPEPSADVRTGTWNVPLSYFIDRLSPADKDAWLHRLRSPATLDQRELGQALYDSGTMEALARLLDEQRETVHRELTRVVDGGPYLAMLLAWIDDLAALVYRPKRRDTGIDIVDCEPHGLAGEDLELFVQLRRAVLATRARTAGGA